MAETESSVIQAETPPLTMHIRNYQDFTAALLKAGFSMGGGSSDGIFAVIPFTWEEVPPYDTPVRWHTGDRETDPWEWRMRVLDERDDIAYSKVFFRKSGYITKEWYPYFLACRRPSKRGVLSFDDAYSDGSVSHEAKRIYETISEHGTLPLHVIKQLAGFGREEKSRFDRALTELQMKLFITMCGQQQKVSTMGLEFGWSSTVFCTTESFFDRDIFDKAAELSQPEAVDKITDRTLQLNPSAGARKILRFIKG